MNVPQLVQQLRKLSSIAVDLDGTLAKHTEGKYDSKVIGDPVPTMRRLVRQWIRRGKTVKIFTARAANKSNIPLIERWLKEHGMEGCIVTNEKTPDMEVIYDDRARQVIANTGKVVKEAAIVRPAGGQEPVKSGLMRSIGLWVGR